MTVAGLICGAASWGHLSLSIFFTLQLVLFQESMSCLSVCSGCAYPLYWIDASETLGMGFSLSAIPATKAMAEFENR